MRQCMILVLFALVVAPVAEATKVYTASQSGSGTYQAFRQKYRAAGTDSVSFQERLALFQSNVAAVRAHNAKSGSSWVAGLNKFADYTDAEFRALLGHRTSRHSRISAASSSFLESRPEHVDDIHSLAKTVDWRSSLNSSSFVKDQGACGSCWAVAAVGALETHAEILGKRAQTLSYEELVDCVPNPQECGGQGGCKGATSELAFQYVQEHGLSSADAYHGYQTGGDGKCKTSSNAVATSQGFERLPENKLAPLMKAVSTQGPVAVSVDASGWSMYQSGVFDSCQRDATINHAVLLVGYGTDKQSGKDYWLIRNSWGPEYGENGYIRIQRHNADEGEAGHCGTDSNPAEGVGCKGGPAKIPVCGMCGVLSDSAFPKDVRIAEPKAKKITN